MGEFVPNLRWWNQVDNALAAIGEPAAMMSEIENYRGDSADVAAQKVWLDRQLAKPDFCSVCGGKRYLISERDDGRRAVERCDTCSADTMTDSRAALLAVQDGVFCAADYPFYVSEESR